MNSTNGITPSDALVWLNIIATVAGFVILALKQDRRVTRIETHLFHIMRKLSMQPRDFDDGSDYGREEFKP